MRDLSKLSEEELYKELSLCRENWLSIIADAFDLPFGPEQKLEAAVVWQQRLENVEKELIKRNLDF